jgi:hypothetical protein
MTDPERLVRLAVAVLVVHGCLAGPTSPAGEPPPAAEPAELRGRMAGFEMHPRDAVYVRATIRGMDVLSVALTDLDDACAAMLEGTLDLSPFEPRLRIQRAHLLTWSVFGGASGARIHPGPIEPAVPPFEGRSPLPPRGDGPFGFPTLLTSDASCAGHPTDIDWGGARLDLRLLEMPEHGPLRGELTIAQAGEAIVGRFSARPCSIPAGTPRPSPAPCAPPARHSPPLSPAELEALADFVPLGMPMGRKGACWQSQLSCRPSAEEGAQGHRVEVTWMATLDHRPTVGRPFPPPTAELDEWDGIYWISHFHPHGRTNAVPTHIGRAQRGQANWVVYRADAAVLEVELAPDAHGLREATLSERGQPPIRLVCAVPPHQGPDAARWTYPSFQGDCSP